MFDIWEASGKVADTVEQIDQLPTTALRSLGVIRSWKDLLDLLEARKDALGVTYETVDHVAGLTPRYSAKVLGSRHKNLGPVSFDSIMAALGLYLIAVQDPDQLARIQHRLVRSKWRHLAKAGPWPVKRHTKPR